MRKFMLLSIKNFFKKKEPKKTRETCRFNIC
nr:MAG TPA: hypothetical protein [Caudoviricetes sp.]